MNEFYSEGQEMPDAFSGLEEIYKLLMEDAQIRNTLRKRSIHGKFPGGKTIEDILSDSFVILVKFSWENNQKDIRQLKPYFIKICQNMINKIFQREGKKEMPLIESSLDNWIVEGEEFEGWLDQEERDRLLWQAVNQLDERCRNFLLLRFKENLSSKEIAVWKENLTYRQVDRIMDKCRAKYRRLIKNIPQFFPLTQYLKSAK